LAKRPEQIGFDPERERTLWHLRVGSAAELSSAELPPKPFVCLLAWNAAAESIATTDIAVVRLLDAGCAYVCTYGTGCERVHDLFDEELVMRSIDRPPQHFVNTTWHTDDTRDQVLHFFLRDTGESDVDVAKYGDLPWGSNWRHAIVVEIGTPLFSPEWLHEVLRDPVRFAAEYEEPA
jgi:hypothetical protein